MKIDKATAPDRAVMRSTRGRTGFSGIPPAIHDCDLLNQHLRGTPAFHQFQLGELIHLVRQFKFNAQLLFFDAYRGKLFFD